MPSQNLTSRRRALQTLAAAGALPWLGRTVARAEEHKSQPGSDGVPNTSWPSARCTPDQRGVSGSALSAHPELRWEVASKDGWVGGAAIVGDRVYAPALAGELLCLDLASGEVLWKHRSIDNPDPKKFAPGFKATPLITPDAVYAGDEDGVLHALDRHTGTRKWTFETGAEIAGCVARYGDHLLLASHDSWLYCLTQEGREVWKFQTNDRINCSPGISDRFTFLAGCDEHLRVLDLDSGAEVRDVPMNSFLIASPALVREVLYVGTHAGEVCAVNWQTGEFVWKYRNEDEAPFHASAAVTDDLVIVGSHDRNLHAIDRTTGRQKWLFATEARIECSAAVVDRRVFVGSQDGNLYGVSLDSGEEVWAFNGGKPVNAGIAIGENCLVFGEDSAQGKLRCFA